MTDGGMVRRRAAAAALAPTVAAVFGGFLGWAGLHDPLAPQTPAVAAAGAIAGDEEAQPAAAMPVRATLPGEASSPVGATSETARAAVLAAEVQALQARVAALRTTLAARRNGEASRPTETPVAPPGAAPTPSPPPAPGAAPAGEATAVEPAPPVHATTRAS